jgi:hypothetical protein
VYSFSEQVTAILPVSLARRAGAENSALDLSGLVMRGRDTYLYTALKASINHLAALPVLRREIVLFSDGGAEDRTHYTLGEITRSAKEAGVVIHTVAFPGQGLKGDTRHVLLQLAGDTGGSHLSHEDRDALWNVFGNRPAVSAGIVKFDDAKSLPYGQSRLKLKLRQGGTDKQAYEQVVFIEGVLTFDNILVTVSRTFGGRDPKRLAAIGAGALLFLVLLAVFARNRLSARARRAQEKQTLEIRNRQEEQKKQLAGIARKLEAVLSQAEKDPEQPRKAFGWLIADSGPVYDLTKASTRIGRSPENEVILPDTYVSNEHAILDFKDGRFIWTDRSPTNSTLINGVRVAGSRAIYPGDRIVCGNTSLRFQLDAMS